MSFVTVGSAVEVVIGWEIEDDGVYRVTVVSAEEELMPKVKEVVVSVKSVETVDDKRKECAEEVVVTKVDV